MSSLCDFNGSSVKVIQIIPAAPGWGQMFADDPQPNAPKPYFVCPIIGWALIEDEQTKAREVVGLSVSTDGEVDFVDYGGIDPRMIRIITPGQKPEDFKDEAEEFLNKGRPSSNVS